MKKETKPWYIVKWNGRGANKLLEQAGVGSGQWQWRGNKLYWRQSPHHKAILIYYKERNDVAS